MNESTHAVPAPLSRPLTGEALCEVCRAAYGGSCPSAEAPCRLSYVVTQRQTR